MFLVAYTSVRVRARVCVCVCVGEPRCSGISHGKDREVWIYVYICQNQRVTRKRRSPTRNQVVLFYTEEREREREERERGRDERGERLSLAAPTVS